ncbi:MAG: hypothetical protein WDW38_007132 [Sanguina aurantia]
MRWSSRYGIGSDKQQGWRGGLSGTFGGFGIHQQHFGLPGHKPAHGNSAVEVVAAVVQAAECFLDEDIKANRAMGAFGADALCAAVAKARGEPPGNPGSRGLRVLTHCNTGSLATAGFGTALGVVRALHERGGLAHAYCTETRPYNQGSRLTAFELAHDGLPATLIIDSAAAALMAGGMVDAVVVGADRVVANGDSANKIGTYALSIAAAHHGIPFFVAAPTTTLDPDMATGGEIEIEQRSSEEVTHFRGARIAADRVQVWNPAFDIAPGALIHGIITEQGLVPKREAGFEVREFMSGLGLWTPSPSETAPSANGLSAAPPSGHATSSPTPPLACSSPSPSGFYALEISTISAYIVARPELCKRVGLSSTANDWTVKEERVRIEAEGLLIEAGLCPAHVPEVYLFDATMCVIAMQFLPPPFIILRRGLIQGTIYPHLAEHVSTFLATTLFGTSQIACSSTTFRHQAARFSNVEMCALTEQVIFTEPYFDAANNHWTSPQLDADVRALWGDAEAKAAVSALKQLFLGRAEALLHGDLHTGSIMVTASESYVIDCEFAYYGPMAFDVAKILSELLLCYFATYGHEEADGAASRDAQRAWLLSTMSETWQLFSAKFLQLWATRGAEGALFPPSLFGSGVADGQSALHACKLAYMGSMWRDTMQFAGAFMIRRIVGIAHVADLESIADADTRSGCERRALRFGRELLVHPGACAADVGMLVDATRTAAVPV